MEYLYGIASNNEDNISTVVAFQVTKKTPKRIYYVRRHWPGSEPIIGFIDRAEFEANGEIVNHGAGGWWADDFHLYAEPPDLSGPTTAPEDQLAEVRHLRRAMGNAHPDRGGTAEEFMAARRRYR